MCTTNTVSPLIPPPLDKSCGVASVLKYHAEYAHTVPAITANSVPMQRFARVTPPPWAASEPTGDERIRESQAFVSLEDFDDAAEL